MRKFLIWLFRLEPELQAISRRRLMSLPGLSTEEQNIVTLFEKGHRLKELITEDGFQDVLDIFEARVAQAEFHLINAEGFDKNARVDKEMIFKLHTRARGMRELFQNVQNDIQAAIQASESIPDILASQANTKDRPGGSF